MKQEVIENKLDQYLSLYRIRKIEEAIARRYAEKKMRCPVHLSIGQESIAVGVCAYLRKQDFAVSGHRAHAHYLAKGGKLFPMIAEIYGKKTGCSKGRGGSMHLIDLDAGFIGSTPIVGGSIPIGVGIAFANQLKNEDHVTAIFFGDGATEEGVFSEAMNFAALKKLSVLFVCENNFYSVSSPLAVRQPIVRDRNMLAEAHGLLSLAGDGNDLQEVNALTEQAMKHLREGLGPCYLEFSTFRLREHCGPEFDYHQPQELITFWKQKDPIYRVLPFITDTMRISIENEIEAAFAFAEDSPYPEVDNACS